MKTQIKRQIVRSRKSQKGLTLIELLVVLVILVGIGGLLLPTINSALSRTHVATCASNFAEVHQMVQRQIIETGGVGDNFDSGIADTVVAAGATAGVNGQNVDVLTVAEVDALNNLGINTVLDRGPAFGDPTFDIDPQQETLVGTTSVAVILDVAQAQEIYLPTGNGERYAWFGIGTGWTGLGTVAPEPPVHFGDTPGFLPDEVYSRFGIVVQLGDAGGTFETAEFKRVSYTLGDTDDSDTNAEFETSDNHIAVYWTDVNTN